jgi:hypothetical protein
VQDLPESVDQQGGSGFDGQRILHAAQAALGLGQSILLLDLRKLDDNRRAGGNAGNVDGSDGLKDAGSWMEDDSAAHGMNSPLP